MARLEYVHHQFFEGSLRGGELEWEKQGRKDAPGLPQIFLEDGRGWSEVNVWALDRAASGDVSTETVKRTMKHLCRYACFLEEAEIDWRHFPVRKEEQVLRRFRKHLVDAIRTGELSGATASNCITSVIQFYRFARAHHLVGTDSPLWEDRRVIVRYFDAVGFEKNAVRLSTDLKIPNRRRMSMRLEDGLLPLRAEHMSQLLAYSQQHVLEELHNMLIAGFFTGARVGTITTLSVSSLYSVREDPLTPGVFLLQVGPGTGIETKFSVRGELMVPSAVLDSLRLYATSTRRLLREARAERHLRDRLFLGRRAQPYTVAAVNRLVHEMRAQAVAAGLPFMHRFRFHQSRATFGTWLMEILLDAGARTDAVRIVRDAMLHKDERTTLGYINFLERQRPKRALADAFNEAFTGLRGRDWTNEAT